MGWGRGCFQGIGKSGRRGGGKRSPARAEAADQGHHSPGAPISDLIQVGYEAIAARFPVGDVENAELGKFGDVSADVRSAQVDLSG